MTPKVLAALLAHAREDSPREACGYIVGARGRETVVRCENRSSEPEKRFLLRGVDYRLAASLGPILAVYHSHPHPHPARPSEADRVACSRSGWPWVIVFPERGDWIQIEPDGYEAPLEGRTYSYGVNDCYRLAQDFYERELGIDLPDFDREPWGFWLEGDDRFGRHYPAAGFVQVPASRLRRADLVVMQLHGTVPHHTGVYLGDGEILHHLPDRLARRERWSDYWQRRTRLFLRHRELLKNADAFRP